MTARIFLKLTAAATGLLLIAAISVDYFAGRVTEAIYMENLRNQLAGKMRMLALTFPSDGNVGPDALHHMAHAAGGRLTMIRSDGVVLLDSEADKSHMENHRSRPEVHAALHGRDGWNIRTSATVGVRFMYVAVPMGHDAIRIAFPTSEIDAQLADIRRRVMMSTLAAFLPALAVAALMARGISGRFAQVTSHAAELARGNFRARLRHTGSSEFGMLARKLNETAENLQNTVEQLDREHAELEKVERVRKDFVINVSHELRTPLASIQGYTETLLDGALNDPKHNTRFLSIIRHNAERLARLTEDLLTLSRIEMRRQKFEFEIHSVNKLLTDAVDLMRPIADKSSIHLNVQPAAADAITWCDSEAVSQILSNLLDNAIKYTPAGGSITVGAITVGNFIELFVRDTGIGIPAEDVPRLFERFYRVDKARSRELGGTGLGLSIVKHLVAAHNGTARVESVVGQGSPFYFTLPEGEAAAGTDQLNPEFTTL